MPSAHLRYNRCLTRDYPHFSRFLLNLLLIHPISSLQGLINEYTISADPINTINDMSDKHRAIIPSPCFKTSVKKIYSFFPSDLLLSRRNRYLKDPKLIDDIDRHIEKSNPYMYLHTFHCISPFPISRTIGFTHIHIVFFIYNVMTLTVFPDLFKFKFKFNRHTAIPIKTYLFRRQL